MPYLTDRTSEEDLLGRSQYVDRLIEMIETCATPYNIAIFGTWGSGKSNLLDFIKKQLEKKIPIVEFSAWKYVQDKDSLRRKLLLETRSQLGEKDYERNIYEATTFSKIDVIKTIKLLPSYLVVSLLWFGAISILVMGVVWLAIKYSHLRDSLLSLYKEWLFVPIIGAIVPLLSSVITNVQIRPPRIESAELFEKSFSDSILRAIGPWYYRFLKYTLHFPKSIQKKISNHIEKIIQNKRVAILIDDLDRCPSDKVIEVLDALMTFFLVPHCVYMVAGDHQIIERAIVAKGKADQGKEKDYLDKIFQFTFPIPPLTQSIVESYTSKQVKNLEVKGLDEEITTDTIVRGLEWNPRKIKLVLNSLRFLVLSMDDPLIRGSKDLLLKTLIIQKEFTPFFNLLTGNWDKLGLVEKWLQTENTQELTALDPFTQNLIQNAQGNSRLKSFLKSPPLWGDKRVMPFFTLTSKTGYIEVAIPNKDLFSQYALQANFGALRQVVENASGENEKSGYLRELLVLYQTQPQEPQKTNVARSFIYCIDLEQRERERRSLVDTFTVYITYPGITTLSAIPANELITLIRQYPEATRPSLFSRVMQAVRRFTDVNIVLNFITNLLSTQDIVSEDIVSSLMKELLGYITAPDINFRNLPFSYIPQLISLPKVTESIKSDMAEELLAFLKKSKEEKVRLLNLLWQIKDVWFPNKKFAAKFKKQVEALAKDPDPNIQSTANSILSQWK